MVAEIITCAGCGQPLDIQEDSRIVECKFCGNKNVLPKIKSKDLRDIYNNADACLRECEFDRASDLFKMVEKEYPNDPQLHWSLAMCNYGIKLEEDPISKRSKPTINRIQSVPFVNDMDYKMALNYSENDEMRAVYIELAEQIMKIQTEFNNTVSTIKPFDVFICYKETDEKGQRTRDSITAETIYKSLIESGFNVFFSRETMNNQYLGEEYEPIIYAALSTAKVMIVVGTNANYVESTWVRNEWKRYIKLKDLDSSRMLILAYRDIKPEDFPQEIASYQGFCVSDNEQIEALVNRVKTSIGKKNLFENNNENKNKIKNNINRAWDELRNKDFSDANKCVEKVLDIDYQNADAHLIKLMIEYHVTDISQLNSSFDPLENHSEFNKFRNYCKDKAKLDELNRINENIKRQNAEANTERKAQLERSQAEYERKEAIYNEACVVLKKRNTRGNALKAKGLLEQIQGFRNVDYLLNECNSNLEGFAKIYIIDIMLIAFGICSGVLALVYKQKLISMIFALIFDICISVTAGITINKIFRRNGKLFGWLLGAASVALYIFILSGCSVPNEMAILSLWNAKADEFEIPDIVMLAWLILPIVASIVTGLIMHFDSKFMYVVAAVIYFFVFCLVLFIVIGVITSLSINITPPVFVHNFIEVVVKISAKYL